MSASSNHAIPCTLVLILALAYPLRAQYPGPGSGDPAEDRTGYTSFQDQESVPPDSNPFAGLGRLTEGSPFQAGFTQLDQEETADQPATISVAELKHPVSRKARKLLANAQRTLKAGKFGDAIRQLKVALTVPSAEPYVHSMLGTIYLLQGHIRDSLPELKLAAKQLPTASNYSNLGLAHCMSGECKQGEDEIERAVQLDNSRPQAHYLLGLIHMNQTPVGRDACEELQKAEQAVPNAGMALAVCFVRSGQLTSARVQLRHELGPVDDLELRQWTEWAKSVAREQKPSAAFGFLPISSPSTEAGDQTEDTSQ